MSTILGIGHSKQLLEKHDLTGIIALSGMTGKLQSVSCKKAYNRPVPGIAYRHGPRGSNERERHSDQVQRLIGTVTMARRIVLEKFAEHQDIDLRKISDTRWLK
jgi:hypothetical protein